jgi:hypothetical protein
MNFKLSLVSVLALSVVIACGKSEDPTVDQAGSVATVDDDVATPATGSGAVVEIIPGLTMRILREGSGAVAESGHIHLQTAWNRDVRDRSGESHAAGGWPRASPWKPCSSGDAAPDSAHGANGCCTTGSARAGAVPAVTKGPR